MKLFSVFSGCFRLFSVVLLLLVVFGIHKDRSIPHTWHRAILVPFVTHCILGKPDQFRVTCPSIRKSNISQSVYYAKNTQDLSMKRRHLTSVHSHSLKVTRVSGRFGPLPTRPPPTRPPYTCYSIPARPPTNSAPCTVDTYLAFSFPAQQHRTCRHTG